MFKWIKKLFKHDDEPNEITGGSYDQWQQDQDKQLAEKKLAWEQENERKKKRDAAYLGTVKTAFYGTYEEWQMKQSADALAAYMELRPTNHNNAQYSLQSQLGGYGSWMQPGGIYRFPF